MLDGKRRKVRVGPNTRGLVTRRMNASTRIT